MKIDWLCGMQITALKNKISPWVAPWDKSGHPIKDWGTPEWNENQNLLVLKIQGFDFLKQGFEFEVQVICSNINGNSRFWQSFDFVVEKQIKTKTKR